MFCISIINTWRLGQYGWHLRNNSFKQFFFNENVFILYKIPLKFVPKGLIVNKSALNQVMTWHQTGDKPLPEPMLTQFS